MKPMATMNVIPFIDIMLVLLAIILTTATFVAQGRIPISLPGAASAVPITTEKKIEITVTSTDGLYLDERAVTMETLPGHLDDLPAQTAILLRIDESVAFSRFVAVIDQLKLRGLDDVSIVASRDRPR